MGKQNPWLQRYAVCVAVCTLILILLGAAVTSYRPPSPGATSALSSTPAPILEQEHRIVGFLVIALTLGLIIWLSLARNLGRVRWLGWAALAVVVSEVGLGEAGAAQGSPGGISFTHAFLAQFFFAAIMSLAVLTSQAWNQEPELVEDRFSIRAMSLALPFVVLAQVALGAAYRHKAMGVLTHIFGAMVVAVFVLLVGCLLLKQYPAHRALRPIAVTLMSITGAQVLLGFAAFLARLMTDKATTAVVIITVAHVLTGALTLATSVVLAIQVHRNVRAASPVWVEERAKTAAP